MELYDPYLEEYAEGVCKIATSVNVLIARAKQISTNLYMVFLELEAPYYNILHSVVMDAIRKMPMANIIQRFVMLGQQHRRPDRGIMDSAQCEISRLILGVCMESVLRVMEKSKGFPISSKENFVCKAFVEKIVIATTTEEDMKDLLNKAGEALKAIGLEKIDRNRCRYVAITFNNKEMNVENDLDFKLAEQEIRGVQEKESWEFLGKKFKVM